MPRRTGRHAPFYFGSGKGGNPSQVPGVVPRGRKIKKKDPFRYMHVQVPSQSKIEERPGMRRKYMLESFPSRAAPFRLLVDY